MFGRFGWAEILVIVVLVIVLFGHNKIPGMMKNLADGINIFKKELKDTKKPAEKTVAAPAAQEAPVAVKAPAKKTTVKKVAAKKAAASGKKTASVKSAEKKPVAKKPVKKVPAKKKSAK